MAILESHQTGTRVVTVVRGRVFRPKSRERHLAPAEKRLVCVLDARQGERLREYGIGQACFGPECRHSHHTRDAVVALVTQGILRWVGKGRNVAVYAYGREWKGMPSGPQRVRVLQLV